MTPMPPRLTRQMMALLMEQVTVHQGQAIAGAANVFGVSQREVRQWIDRAERLGFEAFREPATHQPAYRVFVLPVATGARC